MTKLKDLLKETVYGPKDMIPQGKLGYIDEGEIPGVHIEIEEDTDYRAFAQAVAMEFSQSYNSKLVQPFLSIIKDLLDEHYEAGKFTYNPDR